MDVMTDIWPAVVGRRLQRHGLAARGETMSIVDAVRGMCGAHAQVISAAELSIGLRVAGSTRQDVRRALWDERSLVKTYGPRGTVHLLPAADLAMWTGALAAIPYRSMMSPAVRMTMEQTDDVTAAIADALADAELTIDELSDAVVARTGPWAGDPVMPAFGGMWPRWRQALATAAQRGACVFGTPQGRKVTYTNPRRFMPRFVPEDANKASAWLLRQYLHAYGPATPRNFAQWLSAPVGWANELFAAQRGEMEPITIDGENAWVNAGDAVLPGDVPRSVRLLPYFDAYGVGSHPRSKVFPGAASDRALAGGQAGNYPLLVIDGVVSGVWHMKRSGKKIAILVEPLVEADDDLRHDIDTEVRRIADILEGHTQWGIGTVTVGPHA